jgi:hypothetical protein
VAKLDAGQYEGGRRAAGLAAQVAGRGNAAVKAEGQGPDGKPVSGQAAYFAQGSQVFQVVMYSPRIVPEVAETFFSSLKFE